MAKNRFPVRLPPWHEKYAIWWAAVDGTSKTDIVQSSAKEAIEENRALIDEKLADLAKELGLKVEDLKQELLEKAEYKPPTEL